MIEHSTDIKDFATALVQAQGLMHGASKDSKNPAFKSQYASLESVIAAARPALQKAGIAFLQAPGSVMENGAIEITTMLMHGASGQWMRSTLHVLLGKRDPQGIGSASTYGCRYSLMAMLGLPPVDDDGEGAMDRSAPPPKPAKAAADRAPTAAEETYASWVDLKASLDACPDIDSLADIWKAPAFQSALKALPLSTQKVLNEHKAKRKAELELIADGKFLEGPVNSKPVGPTGKYVAPAFDHLAAALDGPRQD